VNLVGGGRTQTPKKAKTPREKKMHYYLRPNESARRWRKISAELGPKSKEIEHLGERGDEESWVAKTFGGKRKPSNRK